MPPPSYDPQANAARSVYTHAGFAACYDSVKELGLRHMEPCRRGK